MLIFHGQVIREGGDLSESDEEELLVGEVDGRQRQFTAVLRRPVFVRVERRLQAAAVRYVLAQRLTTSQLQTARPHKHSVPNVPQYKRYYRPRQRGR